MFGLRITPITRTFIAFAMVCVALLFAGCASQPPADFPDSVRAAPDAEGFQAAMIVAGSYWYRPAQVIVKAGVPVKLSARKEPGLVPHELVIHAPEAGIDVRVQLATEPKSIEFVPRKAGRYPFFCLHGFSETHRQKGMEGLLIVE